ncbi:MAG: MerR family transcriptional regulator [Acidobacteria bacterium]|nr:MerR family transcriptional regulator [Acidobacteriota bacterium]
MQQPQPAEIPDKLFFKIGEVCELVGVQAHVLRYWETEFPMLQPRKNRAGQRTYRRRDVEMARRIRQLLYDEGFTIAGARKRMSAEGRSINSRFKVVPPSAAGPALESDTALIPERSAQPPAESSAPSRLSLASIRRLRQLAEELLTIIDGDATK